MKILRFLVNDAIINILVVLNSILMFALTFRNLPHYQSFVLADQVFNYIFLVEIIIKAMFAEYRKSKFFYFEVIIVLSSIFASSYFSAFRVLRILKSTRLLRLSFNTKSFFQSIKVASLSILPSILNIYILLTICTIIVCNIYPDNPRFADGYVSFQTLFNMFKGSEWDAMMNDIAQNADNAFLIVFLKIVISFFLIWTCLFTFSLITSKFTENLNKKDDAAAEQMKRIEEKLDKLLNNED